MAFEKIKQILCEEFEIEDIDVTADASLQEDLGLEELDLYDLVMSIEDEFEMELPDEELEKIVTVGDLVEFVKEKLKINRK